MDSEERKISLHPNMAQFYRGQIGQRLGASLDEEHRTEALEVIRTLIEKIVLAPVERTAG